MRQTGREFKRKNKTGKKSFYMALGALALCIAAVGASYYGAENNGFLFWKTQNEEKSELAKNEIKENAMNENQVAGNGAVTEAGQNGADEPESKQASAVIQDESKKADAKKKKAAKKNTPKPTEKVKTTSAAQKAPIFNEEHGLKWPVKGDVLMKFSEKNNVFFKTLAQYRSNPAIEISASKGTKVHASAAGTVTDVANDGEMGLVVTTDIGGKYTVRYGQLKDVAVKNGQKIEEGTCIGCVAEPTRYFSEEGSHLYFQVLENGKAVDPLLLLQ